MAIAYRSSTGTNVATANSITINKPSGDCLLAIISCNNSVTITPPSNWVLIDSGGTPSGATIAAYYKIASSEGASWTWTINSSTSCSGAVAVLIIPPSSKLILLLKHLLQK